MFIKGGFLKNFIKLFKCSILLRLRNTTIQITQNCGEGIFTPSPLLHLSLWPSSVTEDSWPSPEDNLLCVTTEHFQGGQ